METSTAHWSSLALGMVAAETRRRIAARQAEGSLPWIGVDDPSEEQRLQANHAPRVQETTNFQLDGPEKLTGADDPQHALQKNGGVADLWYMDDGDIMCHPILVPSFLQEFDVAIARVGAERNPVKTEVIYYGNDLDAAPPSGESATCRIWPKPQQSPRGCMTLGVAVGPRQHIADQLLAKADVIRAMHESVQLCQDPRKQNLLSHRRVWEVAASATSCECTAARSCIQIGGAFQQRWQVKKKNKNTYHSFEESQAHESSSWSKGWKEIPVWKLGTTAGDSQSSPGHWTKEDKKESRWEEVTKVFFLKQEYRSKKRTHLGRRAWEGKEVEVKKDGMKSCRF